MNPSKAPYGILGDTFEKQIDVAYEKIIGEHWGTILEKSNLNRDGCMCSFRLLPYAKTHKNENNEEIKTNCIFNLLSANSWEWCYSLIHVQEFKDIVKNYIPSKHVLISVYLPQGFTDNVLSMQSGTIRLYSKETKEILKT